MRVVVGLPVSVVDVSLIVDVVWVIDRGDSRGGGGDRTRNRETH